MNPWILLLKTLVFLSLLLTHAMHGGGSALSWLRPLRSAVLLGRDRPLLLWLSPRVKTQPLQQPHRCCFLSSPYSLTHHRSTPFDCQPRQTWRQRSSSSNSDSSSSSSFTQLQRLNTASCAPLEGTPETDEIAKEETRESQQKRRGLKGLLTIPVDPTSPLTSALVIIGRNDQQNERVSFEEAEPSDLWFHAEKVPGGHVLLRGASDFKNVSSSVSFFSETEKLFAADCAAYFSKNRKADRCRVVFAEAQNLEKPRGTPLGTVRINGVRSFLVGRPKRVALRVQAAIEERRQQNNKSKKRNRRIQPPAAATQAEAQ
ncbi:hypothetical protein Esti_004173 [Eimeria stiedai]